MYKLEKNKGISLAQTMIVLSIGAVVTSAGVYGYQNQRESANIDKNTRIFEELKEVSNRVTAIQQNYEGLEKTLPTHMPSYAVGRGSVRTAEGNQVHIAVKEGPWDNSNQDMATFTATGFSQRSCVKMASSLAKDFYLFRVNGQLVHLKNDYPDMNQITNLCGNQDNRLNLSIAKYTEIGRLNNSSALRKYNNLEQSKKPTNQIKTVEAQRKRAKQFNPETQDWGTLDKTDKEVENLKEKECSNFISNNYCLTNNGTVYYPDNSNSRTIGTLSFNELRERNISMLNYRKKTIN